ncbi:Imm15 family immunity protein [Xylocopilactobacillus apicola]|uniref:Uncharacterized protein n=1 Tax=Xylocopilactobacillus apicola TaxID=2932184 RepID=A0AAU9CYX7_9LACO|nr:Imm15 family immunity protein [Xylocopilactobacillus apicola]BDR57621.1 hypothetical protein XA3_00620 [Xylocopilactobacillus apicola]
MKNAILSPVSITDWDNYEEINCLIPNLFISPRKDWLLSKLKLRSTQTVEENLVLEYLFSLDRMDYKVYRQMILKNISGFMFGTKFNFKGF